MVYCAAIGCANTSNKKGGTVGKDGKKVTFHRFPLKDKKLLKEWLIKMKRNDFGLPFKPNADSKMCSEHFVQSDFKYLPFTGRL